MLKKSLIVIALLAIVLPAVAEDPAPGYKVHGFNARTIYDMAASPGKIAVVLDVGYYLQVLDKNDILIKQDDSTTDPYHNYAGCATRAIFSNFDADVKATIAPRAGSLAQGADTKWTVTLKAPGGTAAEKIMIPQGTTPVDICVKGTKINLEAMTGGIEKYPVADITIHFIRAGYATS